MKPLHTVRPILATMTLCLVACGDATFAAQAPTGSLPVDEEAGEEFVPGAAGLASDLPQMSGRATQMLALGAPEMNTAAAQLPTQRPAGLDQIQTTLEEITGEQFGFSGGAGERALFESDTHMAVFDAHDGQLHLHLVEPTRTEAALKLTPEDLEVEAERLLGVLGVSPSEHRGHQTRPAADGTARDDAPEGTVTMVFQRHIHGEPVADHQMEIEFNDAGDLLGIAARWPAVRLQASNDFRTDAYRGRKAAQAAAETSQAAPLTTLLGNRPTSESVHQAAHLALEVTTNL